MSPKLPRPLSSIESLRGCPKPNCSTGSDTLERHHRRHEAMWLAVWRSKRKGEQRFIRFVGRYKRFDPRDVTRICDWHHAEIHSIYDEIIQADMRMRSKRLQDYSWDEANELMSKLERRFWTWLGEPSPGLSPRKLRAQRAKERTRRREERRGS